MISTYNIFGIPAVWLVSLVMGLTGLARAEPAPLEISISEFRNYLPDDHPVVLGMADTAARIDHASNGRVKVKVVNPIADSPQAIVATLAAGEVVDGGPHLVVLPAIGLVDLVPGMDLLNLPFLVRDYPEADRLLEGPFGSELLARLEARGLIALAWWENGFQTLYSVGKALVGPVSFEGITLRLMPDASYGPGFARMGADIVNPPYSQVPQLLESGAIDALDTYISQIYHAGLFRSGDYLNLTRHSYSAMVVVMNQSDWQRLDRETRTLLREVVSQAGARQREYSRESEANAVKKMATAGVNVVAGTAIDRDALAMQLVPGVAALIAENDPLLQKLLREHGYGKDIAVQR